ncbi:MAG TPA: glycosyltransferase [Candidatus Dormibacteraeota bacterium]|nr:glycosyltransferase [Candidatus Dormibacteraeota bacterium]
MPKVSVVIPNYNHARFLRQRIDSVLKQTFQDFEVILLDDSSTDDSRSILSSCAGDPRVRIEFNDANSGSTFKQWNKGVRLARGEYVWIAESDDFADPRFLERLVAVLDAKPQVVFVSCRSWRISDDGQLEGFADAHLNELDPSRWTADFCADGREECKKYLLLLNTVINASAVVFRRAIYDHVGGADESLRLCGDWKLWVSMALLGEVAYIAEALSYFRSHESTVRIQSTKQGLTAVECMEMAHWMLHQVRPSSATEQTLRQRLSYIWIPAMTSGHVPFKRRWEILRHAMAIDPQAARRLLRPMLAALRIKFLQLIRLQRQRSEQA